MSATARRKSGSDRWDTASTPASPDAGGPSKPKQPAKRAPKAAPKAAAKPVAVAATPDQSAETLKRRLMRLALDVHDGPMQNLAVIGFSLSDLRRRLQALVPEEHHKKIDDGMGQISEELIQVEADLRALIGALEENGHQSVPVIEAIEQEIRDFEKRSKVAVSLTYDGEIHTETDSQRIALQSITRAALANVAKHAAATKVEIRLHGDADSITMEIEDDGRGFNTSAPPKRGRFGLVGMRDRVELLGGTFDVASKPGGPTTITARLQVWRPPTAA
jgi:signal transduction histidine kinase